MGILCLGCWELKIPTQCKVNCRVSNGPEKRKKLLDKLGKGVVIKFNSLNALFEITAPSIHLTDMVVSLDIENRIN